MVRKDAVSASSLSRACHENLVEAFESVARIVPGGAIERIGGLTAVRGGMPGPGFNWVFGLTRPTSVAKVTEGIKRLFLRTRTEFQFLTLPETSEELDPVIQAMGLTETEVVPGMVLDPIPGFRHRPPKALKIRRATRPKEATDHLRTGAMGFGVAPDFFDAWKPAILAGASGPWAQGVSYTGYVGGKPAATSVRIRTGGVAGIYFVSTLPEFRRRGFGEAMTWRAISDGRAAGCKLSYLQASKMGRPIYERMGFRVIEEYTEWRKPRAQQPPF
jgi:GNAT superfamily N-acetyltransferase